MNEDTQNGSQTPSELPSYAQPYLAPPAPPFAASRKEKIAAFWMYPLAFCYIQMTFCNLSQELICFSLFCIGFLAMVEIFAHDRRRSAESWVWLGCLLLLIGFRVRSILEAQRFGGNAPVHAIDAGLSFLLLHAYAVYWALCRSDMLLGGESGHFLPLDALNGVLVFPFRHFLLRIRTVGYTLSHLRSEPKKRSAASCVVIAAAVLAAVLLLVLSLQSLSGADMRFDAAISDFLTALTPDWDALELTNFLLKLAMSLLVGAYLFGLIAGASRETPQSLRDRASAFSASLQKLRKVPSSVWTALMIIFALIYLGFFALQAGYLFGAFTQNIPEGFTVAEYARQGFFSLCRVMAINFALLWLVTRSGMQDIRRSELCRVLCTVILAESLLFAVIAASKLYLYIASYGFTPLRLQSAWLILVLSAGCLCALYSLWSSRKSAKGWILFTGITLALLHLY